LKSICTKFAPKPQTWQKENPENLDGIGVFDNRPKAEIISWRYQDGVKSPAKAPKNLDLEVFLVGFRPFFDHREILCGKKCGKDGAK
jgi:hypothetical protein